MTVDLVGDGRSSALELLSRLGATPLPESPCGGRGTCGKCRIRFLSGIPEPTGADARSLSAGEIANGTRLACRAVPEGPCRVLFEGNPAHRAVSAYKIPADRERPVAPRDIPASPLAVAIDVGTTTVAFELVDARTGAVLARESRLNGQRIFGADVVSRVTTSLSGNGAELRRLVLRDALGGIETLLSASGARGADVGSVTVAANTVMTHLFLGLPVEGFARAPFTPSATRFPSVPFGEAFAPLLDGSDPSPAVSSAPVVDRATPVRFVPCVGPFVGGDVVAGLAALDAGKSGSTELFIDLGTNAEMALSGGGRLWCASAAAGPAFEGGSVSSGTGSVEGAVSAVRVEGNRFAWDLVGEAPRGDAPLRGICGTGLVDFVACARSLSLVDASGALSPVCETSGVFLDPAGTVRLLASDVRELQLAKAAVRAGIAILLKSAGIRAGDVSRVWVAGGFGFYLRERSALAIGLFPSEFAGKTVSVGNASLAGASLFARDPSMEARFDAILSSSESVSLADHPDFQGLFLDSMGFDA